METKKSAQERVRELRAEGKGGQEIATVLLAEDYDIETARNAFYLEGYVVDIKPFLAGISQLHVSSDPTSSPMAVIIMSAKTEALPSVVWTKK